MMTVSRNLAASNKCFYSFKKGKSAICAIFFVGHQQKAALNTHDDFLLYVFIYTSTLQWVVFKPYRLLNGTPTPISLASRKEVSVSAHPQIDIDITFTCLYLIGG